MDNLPDTRPDRLCVDCVKKPSVTRDGRFCLTCLRRRIAHENPMIGCFKGMYRTSDHRQAYGEDSSPGGENAIRAMEDAAGDNS